MKRVDAWIELEHRIDHQQGSTGWSTIVKMSPSTSVEEARMTLEYYVAHPAHKRSKYRLMYVRVETTREDVTE